VLSAKRLWYEHRQSRVKEINETVAVTDDDRDRGSSAMNETR
jgi:hypothetical protein